MQARRNKQADKGFPDDFLDCDRCPKTEERRALRCGWLPESEHLPGLAPFPEASVCPGYTIGLPEVIEAARALSWSKRGGLTPLYGQRELPPVATECIDLLEGAVHQSERDELRAQREDLRNGPR